jgi:sugar transferase (PEP-CTERM/EpsH1 system associated)
VRILYLCHRIPYPPNKGDKIRAFHQLRALSTRHEVDLFTLADQAEDMAFKPALAQLCRRVTVTRMFPALSRLRALPFLLSRMPLTIPCFYSAELHAAIRNALSSRSYDRIFVYSSAMAQYLDPASQIPVVMDLVDVDSDKWRQYAAFTRFPFSAVYRREAKHLREYERRACKRASCVLVATEREAELARQISTAPVQVIPNGVDTEYFSPHPTAVPSTIPTVTFTGDMSYFPNEEAVVAFARGVLPLIRRSVPNVRFLVVGRAPGRRVLRLRHMEGVEVTGFVPDVRTYLAQTHVSVAPFSIAAGIQNKILEALAYGLPVVATSRAAQGLSTGVADIVEKGNSPEELASVVVRLLQDHELRRQKGIEGRRGVMTEYDWERSLDRLLQLVEDAGGDRREDSRNAQILEPASYTGRS